MIAVSFLEGEIFCKMGNKYDKVFPVPVGAVTMIFLFSRIQGMTWVWTGVGLWKPKAYSPLISYSLILYFLK